MRLYSVTSKIYFFVVADCMSIPSREEWGQMIQKAERNAKEMLAKYEKKCTELEVSSFAKHRRSFKTHFLFFDAILWLLDPPALFSIFVYQFC